MERKYYHNGILHPRTRPRIEYPRTRPLIEYHIEHAQTQNTVCSGIIRDSEKIEKIKENLRKAYIAGYPIPEEAKNWGPTHGEYKLTYRIRIAEYIDEEFVSLPTKDLSYTLYHELMTLIYDLPVFDTPEYRIIAKTMWYHGLFLLSGWTDRFRESNLFQNLSMERKHYNNGILHPRTSPLIEYHIKHARTQNTVCSGIIGDSEKIEKIKENLQNAYVKGHHIPEEAKNWGPTHGEYKLTYRIRIAEYTDEGFVSLSTKYLSYTLYHELMTLIYDLPAFDTPEYQIIAKTMWYRGLFLLSGWTDGF